MLGVAVLVVTRAEHRAALAREQPADPLSEERASAITVDAVVDIVGLADLDEPSGAYSLRSCSTATDPPYRVVVNMTFAVPQGNPPRYLAGIASAMTEIGWTSAATPAPHFGHKLTRAGLTATFFRNPERTDLATMTVDGECRVLAPEHRAPDVAWVDVTERLRAAR